MSRFLMKVQQFSQKFNKVKQIVEIIEIVYYNSLESINIKC